MVGAVRDGHGAGGGVVGPTVLLDDIEAAQFGFEGVAVALSTGEAGGEDHAVVGQGGGGNAVLACGFAEGGEHDGAGDAVVGGDGERVAGVVIEPGQDLGVGAVGEPVVGEVGLPALVRLFGGEADVGGAGAFARLRGHQPGATEVATDGRRRHGDLVVLGQVTADGVRSGIQALLGELFA